MMARQPKGSRSQDSKAAKLFATTRGCGKRIRLLLHARKEIKPVSRFLRKYSPSSAPLRRISHRVNGCSEVQPCYSGACPRCIGEAQSWFARAGAKFLHDNAALGPWHTLSWVPPGQDGRIDLKKHKRWFERQLRSAGITTAIGGIDLSWNVDKRGGLFAHLQGWRVQVWAVVRADEAASASAFLKKVRAANDEVPHPVQCTPFDGCRAGLAYALKPNFVQRQTISRERKDTGEPGRNTRQKLLSVTAKLELYPALDSAGVFSRIIMIGCQLRWTRKGPRIRLRRPREP